jgi:GNAT superfamily N-acetyltransferase
MNSSTSEKLRELEYSSGDIGLLPQLAQISIALEVRTVYEIQPLQSGLGGLVMVEKPVQPYIKDYDALPGGKPTEWHQEFDMRNWGVVLLLHQNQPIAGAAIARDTPGLNMLAGRRDLAVLWDIRVAQDWRGLGVGRKIFQYSVDWARQRNCTEMKIETQNINVPACRFYARQGCTLGKIDIRGYENDPHCSHEAMLIWYLAL